MPASSGRSAASGKPGCCTRALHATHQDLRDELTRLAEDLLAELPCGTRVAIARTRLLDFVRTRIIPLARREEDLARSAPADSLRQIARALPANHKMVAVLADEIAAAGSGVATAAALGALVLLCDARWDGEDDVLMPALASSGVDLKPLVG